MAVLNHITGIFHILILLLSLYLLTKMSSLVALSATAVAIIVILILIILTALFNFKMFYNSKKSNKPSRAPTIYAVASAINVIFFSILLMSAQI